MSKALIAATTAFVLIVGGTASAEDNDTVSVNSLEWRAIVPDVVYFAPVYGEWEKEAHAKFARIEPGAAVPMHTHSQPYHGVVVSGQLSNLLDSGPTRVDLVPGDYWYMAAGRAHGHVCTSAEPCLVYTHSDGTWDITLVE